MARVALRRIKDGVTSLRTNSKYLAEIISKCDFAKHEKTTRIGHTFTVNRDLDKIPDNIYRLSDYFRGKGDE